MPLVQVVHSIQAVTATVPFSMIMLLDHIKRKSIPPELRVRMIFPTNGLQSCSYWDATDIEQLQQWLDEYLGDDCINTIAEVQEDFAWGISAALGTARGAEAVSARTVLAAKSVGQRAAAVTTTASMKLGELDERYQITTQASKTYSAAREKTAGASKAIGEMTSRAMENENVAKTVSSMSNISSAALKRVGQGFGYLKSKIGEITETVSASVQEYNQAETLHGTSSFPLDAQLRSNLEAEVEPDTQPPKPEQVIGFAARTFKGFDEEQMEAKEPEAAPAPTLAPSTAPAPPAAPVPVPSYTINDESQEIEEPLGLEDDGEDLPGAVESVIRLSDDGEALDPYKVQNDLSAFIDAEEQEINK